MSITETGGTNPLRRKGPDFWIKSLNWISVIGWYLMFGALVIMHRARPQTRNLFSSFFPKLIQYRGHWDATLCQYLFYCMVIGGVGTGIGLIINSRRHRRKEDHYRMSLILIFSISIVGILVYLL